MKMAIRQELRERRKALTETSYAEKSKIIREKLESLEAFREATKILVYLSNEEEVDTKELVKDCVRTGRRVYAPKVEGDSLIICPVQDWQELKPGAFGILEPCQTIDAEHPAEMDLILVPGIGFDHHGHRLGYGRGFYDRLLKDSKGLKVGLAFDEQLVEELPIEAHDIALDLIITDSGIISP